jgi:hypothetical protein
VLFPTRVKGRISGKLSYPVGAELISAELSEVPQAKNIQISFFNKYERIEDRGRPYSLFHVSYSGEKDYDPGWKITVHPVPRDKKRAVREMMRAQVFPQLRNWLVKYAAAYSRHGYHSFSAIFDEDAMTLRVEERNTPDDVVSGSRPNA